MSTPLCLVDGHSLQDKLQNLSVIRPRRIDL